MYSAVCMPSFIGSVYVCIYTDNIVVYCCDLSHSISGDLEFTCISDVEVMSVVHRVCVYIRLVIL